MQQCQRAERRLWAEGVWKQSVSGARVFVVVTAADPHRPRQLAISASRRRMPIREMTRLML